MTQTGESHQIMKGGGEERDDDIGFGHQAIAGKFIGYVQPNGTGL